MKKTITKKMLVPILTSTLLVGTYGAWLPNIHAEGNSTTISDSVIQSIQAKSITKTEKAGELDFNSFTETNIDFNSIYITADNIALKGNVTSNNKTLPFSLKGKFYKTPDAEGRLYGELKDETGNFIIDRFEIEKDPSKGVFINKNLSDESFVLYMTPTNSDQFIIVEDSASKLTTAQNLEQIYSSSLEEPSNDLLLWVGKAFKADEVTQEETKNKPNLLMAQPLKTTVWDFETRYRFASNMYTDKISTKLEVKFPANTNEDVHAILKINGYKMTQEKTGQVFRGTHWRIGDGPNGGNLELRLNANKPQGIIKFGVAGELTKSGTPEFSLGYTLDFYGIGAGIEWKKEEVVTLGDFRNVMGAGVANARKVKNVYMDRGGQHFDAYWDLEYDPKHGAMKSADATITVKFTAYNTLDKEVKGPIIAYSTSSNPIVTKP